MKKWVKVSELAIQSGEWTICKCSVNAKWRYALYKGNKLTGTYETSETAKEAISGNQADIAISG